LHPFCHLPHNLNIHIHFCHYSHAIVLTLQHLQMDGEWGLVVDGGKEQFSVYLLPREIVHLCTIYIYICALCRHPSQNLPHLYTISQVDTTTKCNVGGDPNPPTCSLVRENGSSWYIL
jgi:hypothetical protein